MNDSGTGEANKTLALIQQIRTFWLGPELRRRGLPETQPVSKCLVVMPPTGPITVQIDDEAELIGTVRVNKAMPAGAAVTTADISSVEGLRPASVDVNAGWICLAEIGGTWTIVNFDFRYNRGSATQLLSLASEHLASARDDLQAGRERAAVDAAWSAAELAVQAQMMLINVVTKDHKSRNKWWESWQQLGNAPSDQGALKRLASERPNARYGEGPLGLTQTELDNLMFTVEGMVQHASERLRD